ncbi:hypothetical protein BD770DRAFT_332758 [Pilaira anomala]|nr:hypothetical protein BD770DRAFT_332758 [Pilaira anomala]
MYKKIDLPQTILFQKPDAIDTPKYEKPNAYDDDDDSDDIQDTITVTASRNGSRSSKMTVDSFSSCCFQKREPTIVSSPYTPSSLTKEGTKVISPTLLPFQKEQSLYHSQIDYQNITRFILSQHTLTTQTTFGHHHEESLPYLSAFSPAASLDKPNQHCIFLQIYHADKHQQEEVMAYRKIQPYSYTWGFQSILYSNRNDGQGIKVAEARRKTFQKEIIIESADYNHTSHNIHSHHLIKRSQSNILFEYEIWFHGSRIRWKRPSLLSPDFTCEIKLTHQETKLNVQSKEVFIDSDSDNDEDDHDNHTHKNCRRWKLLAEFDSDNMNYLNKEYGKFSIDLDILNQVEKDRCDLLEANIIMTCCTLIDLIRDTYNK